MAILRKSRPNSLGYSSHLPGSWREDSSHRRPWIGRFHTLLLILAVLVTACAAPASATPAPSLSEYQVKAAFLYNFARFVEWPAEVFSDNSIPIVLGIVGEDRFGSILEEMVRGKTVNGRPLKIKRPKGAPELKSCHILFISSSEGKQISQILESVKDASILTVGEVERFSQLGGIINFTVVANKVHLEINIDIAARARVKISSKLLSLAKIVRGEARKGPNGSIGNW